ncbi:MAG: DUF2442 domain-containing protein [Verrucomicrobiae bacterium]|nr:DUF2442 domain-containing protein [Verrucomicrobiae bacterium]
MNAYHQIKDIKFTETQMLMHVDGKDCVWDLKSISARLANARDFEREKFQVSTSGYGIHWPLLDEDLSIDGLIRAPQAECVSHQARS